MRIFLIGARGYIGTHLIHFLQKDHVVYFPENHLKLDGVQDAILGVRPDCVINLAARGVLGSDRNLNELKMVNCALPREIGICCKRAKIKLVHFGTCFEYGVSHFPVGCGERFFEVYGETKLSGTVELMNIFKESYQDLIIIRPFQVFGGNEPSYRLLPSLIQACKTDLSFQVCSPQSIRNFIYIKDLCLWVSRLVKTLGSYQSNKKWEVIKPLAFEPFLSVKEFCEIVVDIFCSDFFINKNNLKIFYKNNLPLSCFLSNKQLVKHPDGFLGLTTGIRESLSNSK